MKNEKKKPLKEDDIDLFEDWENEPKPEDSITDELEADKLPDKLPATPTAKPPKEEQLPKKQPPPKDLTEDNPSPVSNETINMSSDISVQLVAVIGKTSISVRDMMNYHMGQVIELGRPPSETVDLVASGKLFARGELVDIDGKLGVRIIKLIK